MQEKETSWHISRGTAEPQKSAEGFPLVRGGFAPIKRVTEDTREETSGC
jgi:hypothetical protein